MISIDKLAYISALRNKSPIEKFLFSMITLIFCLGLNKPLISLLVLIFMSTILVNKGQLPLKTYIKLMLLPFTFLIIGVLTIAVNIVDGSKASFIIFHLKSVSIGCTMDSLKTAGEIGLKALASVACLYFLILTTPVFEILIVLRKLKCPKLFVELMGLIYRFIFVILDRANMIFISQNSRLGYSNIRLGYNSLGKLVASLFISSYKKSQDVYMAMEARGYMGEINLIYDKQNTSYRNMLKILSFEIVLVIIRIVIYY
ncbi:cobalt ECF transporter T component CbiQ [Clostridium manihotivorum]|uniref:Cobalt ECF transporter T component CbiQ n=2 Tax=Clostridium manihotivorum TaxID=2320868 RepID=A0A3R5QYJ4_9CLOT|nr:cobalt ECF transporter T component CbiQ [Clostridium manihotivorum]QAA35226.1 cobalt ECF transporter T component CbiQ [Clostridium manihotivorum]